MKKVIVGILSCLMLLSSSLIFTACKDTTPPPEDLELSTIDESVIENISAELSAIKEKLSTMNSSEIDYTEDIEGIEIKLSNIETKLDELKTTCNTEDIITSLETIKTTLNAIKANQTVSYTKVLLTTSNYTQYITINITFDNFIIDYIETDSLGYRKYNLACRGVITTSNKIDCHFENVSITYHISIELWNTPIGGISTDLDYYGLSSLSFSATQSDSAFFDFHVHFPNSNTIQSITVSSIFGYVYIPN